jgi:hypothetical protein
VVVVMITVVRRLAGIGIARFSAGIGSFGLGLDTAAVVGIVLGVMVDRAVAIVSGSARAGR